MKPESQKQSLDSRIYSAIKALCNEDANDDQKGAAAPGSIRVRDALSAFGFLAQRASAREIEFHKGDYLRMFNKTLNTLAPVAVESDAKDSAVAAPAVEFTPTIVVLADWFLKQNELSYNSNYRNRLIDMTKIIAAKNLPVPSEKKADWTKKLAPKRPRSTNIRPLNEPAETCTCTPLTCHNRLPSIYD